MKNNLNILKFFVEHKDATTTINQIAKALKMNYRIVYEGIMKLEQEKLIKITRIGNANICQFAYIYNNKVVEIEEERKEEVFKNKDIALIHKRISEIENPFYIFILFGSYANKTQTKNSDIDLCLITDNEKINKIVNNIIQITPLKIQLQEFTTEQFQTMIKTRETNVGSEIKKNNIIFHGLESFYGLIQNAE